MPAADLAPPRRNEAGQQDSQDPFASPASQAIQTPRPCAQAPYDPRSAQRAATNTNDQADYDRRSRAYYKSSSFSSEGSGSMTPVSSMDLEKSSTAQETAPRRQQHDPEKAVYPARHHPRQTNDMSDNLSMTYSEDDGDDSGRRLQEDKAINILLFLSGPCVILSALNTAWTCIALVISLLSQPVRLCAKRPGFGQQLSGLLGPALNLQLRRIYTPLPPHANEDGSYNACMLVAVHLLSPFISVGIMFLAWVLAVYWLSSAVVGDPAGMDKRDDGRETVLGLRNWWETYLMRSVKDL